MALLLYQQMFIKELVSKTQDLETFNLTDPFYKEFVNRNNKYMLFMLRPLRDIINSIICDLLPYKAHLLYGCCTCFSNYENVRVCFILDCDVIIKKPVSTHYAIVKCFDLKKINDKTILTAQITIGCL